MTRSSRSLRSKRRKLSRKRIFEVIEKPDGNNRLSPLYNILMIIAIILSLIPLAFKEYRPVFRIIDRITVIAYCRL